MSPVQGTPRRETPCYTDYAAARTCVLAAGSYVDLRKLRLFKAQEASFSCFQGSILNTRLASTQLHKLNSSPFLLFF